MLLALGALVLVALVSAQFEGIVAKNLALGAQVRDAHARIDDLVAREARQRRTIARLQQPQGAIPEIHSELRLIAPDEELIEVRGQGDAQPPTYTDSPQ